ncbi:uncharacterized protein L201_000508 [Kwoniella dendrophila CBS 6074]|uniref:Uncharacterized protein n=1 Tax=Kwoniella dendrophila CBS 6074 TaxID=1295534 RepID=A0AAX4JJQ6_9TREE
MRTSTFLLALGLFTSVLAAPVAQPNSPVLYTKDPLSIHRRSEIPSENFENTDLTPEFQAEIDSSSSSLSSSSAITATTAATEPAEDACNEVCGVKRVEGAKSEREALCSSEGLLATLQCAQCIDQTWPDTSYDDSAMAEYERIVSACDASPQL